VTPENVTAVCAIVVAVASLVVAVVQARAAIRHNRNSVRPMLRLHRVWKSGDRTGVRLINSGLGPAIVTHSVLRVDNETLGTWSSATTERLHEVLAMKPSYVTFDDREVLATGYSKYLLSVPSYDPLSHESFADLISRRIEFDIHYESLYGGEKLMVTLRPR
jgi:hypothetical protein